MTEPQIHVTHTPDGRRQISVSAALNVTDGSLPTDDSIRNPAIIHPTATPPRLKLKACEYFLARAREYLRNEAAALFYIEAFVQSLRSATFVLQKAGSQIPGYADWYASKQEEMRQDPLLKALVNLRNATEKEGVSLVEFGLSTVVKRYADGRLNVEAGLPKICVLGHPIPDPLASFDRALLTLHALVEEAHQQGFVRIPENKQAQINFEFMCERPDGTWEHCDP
jgi:hypothetical protein